MNSADNLNAFIPFLLPGLVLAILGYAALMFHLRMRPFMEPRYVVESQSSDTGVWKPIASTDNFDHAQEILTGRHRRIFDRKLDEVVLSGI